MAKKIVIQAPCNECVRNTDHWILKTHRKHATDEGMWWETKFDMLECCGCHSISLRRMFNSSEWDEPGVEYFPPPISRRKPGWYDALVMNIPVELELSELLTEVYSALHADNRRLATMGARTLLDMVMTDKVKDVGRFDQKLDALEREFVTKRQRQYLEAALEAGNAAAHRGHCPTAQQLNHVMDIVESVLHQLYVLPHAAEELKKTTPPRKRQTT